MRIRGIAKQILPSLVVIVVLAAAGLGEPVDKAEDRASVFFDASNVRVNETNGAWWLRLETPELVLCAVNIAQQEGPYDTLTAMDMTAPAIDHDIELPNTEGLSFRFVLTAFTVSHEILRSWEYIVEAREAEGENENLVVRRRGVAFTVDPIPADRVLEEAVEILEIEEHSAVVSFRSRAPMLAS